MKEGSAQVPGPRSRRDRWILPGGKTGQTLNVRAKLLTRLQVKKRLWPQASAGGESRGHNALTLTERPPARSIRPRISKRRNVFSC